MVIESSEATIPSYDKFLGTGTRTETVVSRHKEEIIKHPHDYVYLTGNPLLATRTDEDALGKMFLVANCWFPGWEKMEEDYHMESRRAVTLNNRELKQMLGKVGYARLWLWKRRNGIKKSEIEVYTDPLHIDSITTPYYLGTESAHMLVGGKSALDTLGTWRQDGGWEEGEMEIRPLGSIKGYIRCLELAERLNLTVNNELMLQANKEVGSGRLSLEVDNQVDFHNHLEYFDVGDEPWNTHIYIDDETVTLLVENSDRFNLPARYPKLVGLAREISQAGGAKKFILEKYGEAYLKRLPRGVDRSIESDYYAGSRIRLYYPDLTKSSLTTDEQNRLLYELYKGSTRAQFPFESVSQSDGESLLPHSAVAEKLRGTRRFENAIKRREASYSNEFPVPLGKWTLKYKALVNTTQTLTDIKVGIVKKLLGVTEEMWKRGSPKVGRKFSKLGFHTGNPLYSELQKKPAGSIEMTITDDPIALMQASTEKPWTSCMDLAAGSSAKALFSDVAAGSKIAYFFKDGKVIGRFLVRETITTKGKPAASLERYYGDPRFEIVADKGLREVLQSHGIKTEAEQMVTVSDQFRNGYSDTGTVSRRLSKILYGLSADEYLTLIKSEARENKSFKSWWGGVRNRILMKQF